MTKGLAPNPYQGPGGGTTNVGVHKTDIVAAGQIDFSSTGGTSLFSGSGAPGNAVGNPPGNPAVGDFYLRTDTPGTANQRLYVCTVGGAAPTWVGIA